MKTQSAKQSSGKWLNPAGWRIVQAVFSTCPCCNSFQYSITEHKRGLPCKDCGMPTDRILSEVYACKSCGYAQEQFFPEGDKVEDSLFCDFCTPNHR
ncbi:MAG: hypothetical protein M9931_05010 [Chitinophagales bacterium]|nr:hypothetical protein [Chitinophagales bacterium]MCO5280402.1 hypothetical protein [Chitinophagales bacterium]OJV25598.1 MAG: hypothetical protein BGO32_00880 [Bacteroidetes bacterium 37-13]HRN95506.1 hypothetical protein [Chitinophagales bacterium]HRP38191.1 hypothetical protein [Chitinophagales bacterium]